MPMINAKVIKFFRGYEWFDVYITHISDKGIFVLFTDGEDFIWTMDEYQKYACCAVIPVGAVEYDFVNDYRYRNGKM